MIYFLIIRDEYLITVKKRYSLDNMDEYADFFPYPQYRPHQKQMLDFAYDVAKKGGIGLINAPTGSGKTSVISAVLASVKDKPRMIIIASRMVSQIEIYTKELDLIRSQKKPGLKYAYIIGKNKSCKRFDEQEKSLLNRCRKLCRNHKKNTLNHKDPESKLEECSWYANSVIFNENSKKFEPSLQLTDKVSQFVTTTVDQSGIKVFSEPCCPYEVMKHASNYCDVIVCNYHHLLNPVFRSALFANYFGSTRNGIVSVTQKSPIVIFDEAHNLPNEISNLFSTSINKASIDEVREFLVGAAYSTIDEQKISEKETEFASQIRAFLEDPSIKPLLQTEGFTVNSMIRFLIQTLVATSKFMEKLNSQKKNEAIIDPGIFLRYICIENNEDDEGNIIKKIRLLYSLIETFEPHEDDDTPDVDEDGDDIKSLSVILKFLSILIEHYDDPSVIKIFLNKKTEEITDDSQLKLKFIDPEPTMREIVSQSHCVFLMSGTLQPPEAYGQILFGVQQEVRTITLPNSFPKENRKLIVANDCTTLRRNLEANKGKNKNNETIAKYVSEFAKIPGNIAIFCPSYVMVAKCQKILEDSKVQNVFIQPQNNEDTIELKKKFIALPDRGEHGILIGVSGGRLSEGIDYIGNSLVGVMVIGLPLAKWDIIEKSKIRYYQRKFGNENGDFLAYTLPAFNKSLQAVGRVIRSENDKGIMILCDKRYLDQKIYSNLPEWMLNELLITNISHFHNKCSLPQ